jgi:NAD(P)-dependent dehydrogenase (short-subunit alcohol dehydrogenase family)
MPSSARVALITGCGKPIGIGNSTARALAAAGVTVVVSDVVPAGVANEHNVKGDLDPSWRGVDGLVEELVRTGKAASSTLGDVSMEADARRMVEEVLGRYGRLDILVNNAGAPQGADRNEIEDVPVEVWDLTMGVNARGTFLMSRAAVPAMRKAGWGRIINVSSKAAFRPGRHRAPPMLPRKPRLSASRNRWPSISRHTGSRSTPSVPDQSAPRGQSARTAANTAMIWNWDLPSAPKRSRSAVSAAPTRWRR